MFAKVGVVTIISEARRKRLPKKSKVMLRILTFYFIKELLLMVAH